MPLKPCCIFFAIALAAFCARGQSSGAGILDAYFDALVLQRETGAQIEAALQRIAPGLLYEYNALTAASDGEAATLDWTYFLKKLEREPQGQALAALCREGRKVDGLVRRFHTLGLVDPFSQTVVDTAQAIRRLLFFGIEPGARIAEIGFGYGYNLNLLGLAYETVEVYANELDAYRLKKMEEEIAGSFPATRRDNFFFVQGAETSTNLEGKSLDVIILENVFHHIAARAVFLESIAASLAPDGTVILIEEFIEQDSTGNRCPELMPRAQVESLLLQAGFRLANEEALRRQHKIMLRWVRQGSGHDKF